MMWKGRWQGTGYRNDSGARSGLWLRHWWWCGWGGTDVLPAEQRDFVGWGSWRGSTRGLPGPDHNQGPSSFEAVAKDLRSIPMENMKDLSLDEATLCPHLTDVDKWIWTTHSAFLSSPREVFVVGDLLLGPRGWDPVCVWEGHWLGEWIPLFWDATRELCRMKDSQLQECLVSTNRWKKIPPGAFLHL